jgi:hypothetical protein
VYTQAHEQSAAAKSKHEATKNGVPIEVSGLKVGETVFVAGVKHHHICRDGFVVPDLEDVTHADVLPLDGGPLDAVVEEHLLPIHSRIGNATFLKCTRGVSIGARPRGERGRRWTHNVFKGLLDGRD